MCFNPVEELLRGKKVFFQPFLFKNKRLIFSIYSLDGLICIVICDYITKVLLDDLEHTQKHVFPGKFCPKGFANSY